MTFLERFTIVQRVEGAGVVEGKGKRFIEGDVWWHFLLQWTSEIMKRTKFSHPINDLVLFAM